MTSLTAVVVGARRHRQGLGPYITRYLCAEGVRVIAIVGTTNDTVNRARESLAADGIHVSGYTSLGDALANEQPDVVAICTPHGHHRAQLEVVARAGCHCLCEKPLWWESTMDSRAGTVAIADGFVRNGRHLAMVTQWPLTLPFFFQLFPHLSGNRLTRFTMGLSPAWSGIDMIADAAPHGVSMLQALFGTGAVIDPVAEHLDRFTIAVAFEYAHAAGTAGVSLHFASCAERPAPAWYSVDGCRVDRRIESPGYRTVLATPQGEVVDVPDPVHMVVRRFAEAVRAHEPTDAQRLVDAMVSLGTLDGAVRRAINR